MNTRRLVRVGACVLLLGLLVTCQYGPSNFGVPHAYRVTSRAQLIGGPKAVGRVGDVIIENDKIRLLINAHPTDPNTVKSGGGLVDADIQRVENYFSPALPGQDELVELLPLIDVKMAGIQTIPGSAPVLRVAGDAVDIVDAGGGADSDQASVKITGVLTNAIQILRLLPTPLNMLPMQTQTTYTLHKGQNHVEITTSFIVLNKDGSVPSQLRQVPLRPLTPSDNVVTGMITNNEFGDAVFFGSSLAMLGPDVFGFSPDWQIQDEFEKGISMLTAPFMVDWTAGVGAKVSYGLVSPDSPIVFPFMESFLTVGFQKIAVDGYALPQPGDSFSYTRYFIVTECDAAGVLNDVIPLKGWESAHVAGHVFDAGKGAPVSGSYVVVFKHPRLANGDLVPMTKTYDEMNQYLGSMEVGAVSSNRLMAYSRFHTDSSHLTTLFDAEFDGNLPVFPGDEEESYILMAFGPGHVRSDLLPIHVRPGENLNVSLFLPATGTISFNVSSTDNLPQTPRSGINQPCRVTVFGANQQAQPDPFLGDGSDGEGFLPANEAYDQYSANGTGTFTLPPGQYRLVANRGPEYSTDQQMVTVTSEQTVNVNMKIARVVDTAGWLAADLHTHTELSPDSGTSVLNRVLSAMCAGLDVIAGTDHDFIVNERPYLDQLNALNNLYIMSGVELSQMQYGHFNSYPLVWNQAMVSNGAPNWRNQSPTGKMPDGTPYPYYTPQDIFTALRKAGDRSLISQDPVVVVNHSRETFTGYLRSFGYLQYTGGFGAPDIMTLGDPVVNHGEFYSNNGEPNFSWNFDAMEVINGKRLTSMRTATEEEITKDEFGQPMPTDSPLLPVLIRTADEQVRIASGQLLMHNYNLGMVDDYFTLLVTGHRVAPMGNSDSHNMSDQTAGIEAGKVRTYVMSTVDESRFVDPNQLATNIKAGRTMATTGPFVELWVDGHPIGSNVVSESGVVSVRIKAQAPQWMSLNRLEIYGNGNLVGEIGADVNPSIQLGCDTADAQLAGSDQVIRFDGAVNCTLERDTVFNVIAIGYQGMSPVNQDVDGVYIELTDTLLLGVNQMLQNWIGIGNLLPQVGDGSLVQRVHPSYPYAVTGAIWVSVGDDHPYQGPGYIPAWFAAADVNHQLTAGALSPDQQKAVAAAIARMLSFTSQLDGPEPQGDPDASSATSTGGLHSAGCGS
jgi:hypothetical protein